MKNWIEQFSLTNKTVIVTGATGGLARELVRILLDAGANIVLADIDKQALADFLQELNAADRVITQVCDVTSKKDIKEAIVQTHKTFGRIDILINCAGVLGGDVSMFDVTESDWDKVIDVNLKGTWLFATEVARHMVENNIKGKIINISSALGYLSCLKRIHYAPSKAGVEHLTRNMAMELIDYGIAVNCLAPGWINTPMVKQILEGPKGDKWREVIPMKRAADPKELCGPLLLLASEASSYMTGVVLRVDGGSACCGVQLPKE